MRKFISLSLMFTVLIAVSCKKEKSQEIQKPAPLIHVPNYMPLEIGNYWIYETYRIIDNQEILQEGLDSVSIIRDTIIRGETYFQFGGQYSYFLPYNHPIRDSLGYMVNSYGNILFTLHNIGEVFVNQTFYDDDGDTVYNMQCHINPKDEYIEIPAGLFYAKNKITNYIAFPQHENFPESLKYRTINSYFIDGIGQATNQYIFSGSLNYTEKKLIRYHIVNTEE